MRNRVARAGGTRVVPEETWNELAVSERERADE